MHQNSQFAYRFFAFLLLVFLMEATTSSLRAEGLADPETEYDSASPNLPPLNNLKPETTKNQKNESRNPDPNQGKKPHLEKNDQKEKSGEKNKKTSHLAPPKGLVYSVEGLGNAYLTLQDGKFVVLFRDKEDQPVSSPYSEGWLKVRVLNKKTTGERNFISLALEKEGDVLCAVRPVRPPYQFFVTLTLGPTGSPSDQTPENTPKKQKRAKKEEKVEIPPQISFKGYRFDPIELQINLSPDTSLEEKENQDYKKKLKHSKTKTGSPQ